jgi:hypothetical protein
MKASLTLDQQVSRVRRFGESSALPLAGAVNAAGSVVGVLAFLHLSSEPARVAALLAAGIGLIVSLAMFAHYPQLKRAARATRAGRRSSGVLHLEVDRSDSENPSFSGAFRDGRATWNLEFGKPMGWSPQPGEWPCTLVFVSDEAVPALAILEEGLLFPSRRSRKTYERPRHPATRRQ